MAITTWDPSNTGANITLSAGNLTATTTTTANGSVHGTGGYIGSAALLLYYEARAATVVTAGNTWGIGIAATTASLSAYCGQNPASCGLYQNGKVYNNALSSLTFFTFVSGAVIGIAVDFPHQKLWFTANGTTWNNAAIGSQNPATNTGGVTLIPNNNPWITSGVYNTVVPCFGATGSTGNVGTADFGATAFTYPIPSGFQAWDFTAQQSVQARAMVLA
jgi:SPRY domain